MSMWKFPPLIAFARTFRCFLVVFLVFVARCADGWGKIGHEMVANLAYERLSTESQASIGRILRGHYNHSDEADAGSPLAAVANWADRVRFTKAFHWSMPLHYIDVKDSTISGGCPCNDPTSTKSSLCHFVYSRDCNNDRCVAGAILNFTLHLETLSSNSGGLQSAQFLRARGGKASRRDELIRESLMFLTHFVGDIHQPLHSARGSDKGGNSFHVQFDHTIERPVVLRTGSLSHHWNLHSIWDDAMIERALVELYNSTRDHFEADLMDMIEQADQTGELDMWLACSDGGNKTCVSRWAEESLDAAVAWAYRNVDGSEVVNGTTICEEYYETRLPVVQRRIAAAAVRLAATLEAAVGSQGASIAATRTMA